ncbi:hypothetical protein VCPCS023_002203 [Vibrio cholerae O1 str. PCS-023]|nr:hypothetical protein VCPCS023_002203 [Vibrio cholerae O1 str. PCS-023]
MAFCISFQQVKNATYTDIFTLSKKAGRNQVRLFRHGSTNPTMVNQQTENV